MNAGCGKKFPRPMWAFAIKNRRQSNLELQNVQRLQQKLSETEKKKNDLISEINTKLKTKLAKEGFNLAYNEFKMNLMGPAATHRLGCCCVAHFN